MSEGRVGPQGGNLDNPVLHPHWREAGLNVETLPGGGIGLHRFEPTDGKTATLGNRNEQPWHRMAAYMLNAGRTNSEIAMAAGVTPNTVSQIRAQKWFQELCAIIANKEGEEITGLIHSYVAEAVEGIHDIATSAESDRVRLSAYNILLEQGRGKPLQRTVSLNGHTTLSPEDEMAELTQELRNLRQISPAPALLADATVSTPTVKET